MRVLASLSWFDLGALRVVTGLLGDDLGALRVVTGLLGDDDDDHMGGRGPLGKVMGGGHQQV